MGSSPSREEHRRPAPRRSLLYDKAGESTATSSPPRARQSRTRRCDYWLARMLESGRPVYPCAAHHALRREDIGLADTNALAVAINACLGRHFIGMPEYPPGFSRHARQWP